MTSSTPLNLFPAPHRTAVPRKSSLKKFTPDARSATPGELKGVAIQVNSPCSRSASPVVQPATDHIKHSLFCDAESATPGHYIQGRPKKHVRSRRRSSASQLEGTVGNSPYQHSESWDEITPLPENTNFGTVPASPQRYPASQLRRPLVPAHISTEVLPDEDMMARPLGDRPSPLPTQDSFNMRSPARSDFSPSVRSNSPTLVRSNSGSTIRSGRPPPTYNAAARSIFPVYDHTRTFQEQQYYPTARTPTPTIPSEKVSKFDSPVVGRPKLDRFDSAVTIVDNYEHIPIGQAEDMAEVWNASSNFQCAGRKIQLGLHQPYANGTSLAIGVAQDKLLYSMTKLPTSEDKDAARVLAVNKHSPQNTHTETVAQMGLPDPSRSSKQREKDVVVVFPQMAAVHSIEAISNSPAAAEIAVFDPTASGPEAKRSASPKTQSRKHTPDTAANSSAQHASETASVPSQPLTVSSTPTLAAFPSPSQNPLPEAVMPKTPERKSVCTIPLRLPQP